MVMGRLVDDPIVDIENTFRHLDMGKAPRQAALDSAIRACLKRGAAVVVVAHRPSALHAMNELLVLANGQVAAYGNRDEILKKVSGKPQSPAVQPQQQIPSLMQIAPQTRN